MNVKNPKPSTVKKMKQIDAYKKDRYTYVQIAKMMNHSVTYVKELHIFYRTNLKGNK